jgi:hypothetical protein
MILEILSKLTTTEVPEVFELREVGQDEKVLGTAGPMAQKLWVITDELEKALKKEVASMKAFSGMTLEEVFAFKKRTETTVQQIDILKELFWREIREDLGNDDPESIGLRKDWQIVTISESETPVFKIILEPFGISSIESFLRSGGCGNPDCKTCNPKSGE